MLLHFEIKLSYGIMGTKVNIRTEIEDDESAMYFYKQALHKQMQWELIKVNSVHDVNCQTWTLSKTSFNVEFLHNAENIWKMYNELIPQAIMNAIGKCCCNYSYQELIENPKGSEAHFIFVVRATW